MLCLSAWLALLPPSPGAAQDRGGSPETLWKEYPLAPTAAPSAEPSAEPTAASSPAPRSTAAAADTDGGVPVDPLVLLALLTAVAGTITFLGMRHRRESEPQAAAAPAAPVEDVSVMPALWHGRSGRFARKPSDSRATAIVASAQAGGRPPAETDAPAPRVPEAAPAGRPSPVTPPATGAPAGSPPDRRLAWTAEIEWRDSGDESRFCVVARGPGTVMLAQSDPQEWPPTGPTAVNAMKEAAARLAAMLADAGWKELEPGASWYSKRFEWEPVAAESPVKPVAAPDAKPERPRSSRPRWQTIALLCVLVALAPIAVYALSRDVDNAPPVRSAPTPTVTATETPAAQPSPEPTPSSGADLTGPLIVLLGLVALILLMIRTQRARR